MYKNQLEMKATITDTKNMLKGIKGRLTETEDSISDFKYKVKINHLIREAKRKNTLKA